MVRALVHSAALIQYQVSHFILHLSAFSESSLSFSGSSSSFMEYGGTTDRQSKHLSSYY
jgi:hypothetical protein